MKNTKRNTSIDISKAHARKVLGALLSLSLAAPLLTGCGMMSGTGRSSSVSGGLGTTTARAGLGGNVHGGQQAVSGAHMILWAAGTASGYGAGATVVATTTTGSDGSFNFDTAGVSPCTLGQYLYITATGGDTGAGTNNASALMAALANPCDANTGSLYLQVNEESTVAAVTALQQFMSIDTTATIPYTGTGTKPWNIGAPSTNVTGMANAFKQAGLLVDLTSGLSMVTTNSQTYSGTTYTTTITPDIQKINTLADILALCVNDSSGVNCTGTNGVLTQTAILKGSTTITPVDTVQAMYNMASLPNPQLSSSSTDSASATVTKYFVRSTSSQTYLATLWANVTATAPFQPYTTTVPTDTAIEIAWKNTGGSLVLTTYPQLAFDASGNVWYAYGNGSSTSPASVVKYSPAGAMQFAPITTTTVSGGWDYTSTMAGSVTLGSPKANSIAVDTNNNAWYAGFYTAATANTANSTGSSTVGTYQTPLAQITPTGVSTGYLVGASPGNLSIDGNNNLFFDNVPNSCSSGCSARYYFSELVASGTTPYSTYYGGAGRLSSTYFNGSAIDGSSVSATNGQVWGFQSTCQPAVYRDNQSQISGGGNYPTSTTYTAASVVTLSSTSSPTTCVLNGAIDANGNLWGTNGYLEYVVAAGTSSVSAPTVTAFASTAGSGLGGLSNAAGVAIDGLGNVWVANNVSATAGGVSEFAPTLNGSVPTLSPLSPTGTSVSPVYGFGSSYGWGKPTQPRIDGSGNVWMENNGNSSIFYLVGIAAPVVTPTALAVKNGTVGTRP